MPFSCFIGEETDCPAGDSRKLCESSQRSEQGFPKAKVASSILAGGANAKTAKNNVNTGRFVTLLGAAQRAVAFGERRIATQWDGRRRGAWQ